MKRKFLVILSILALIVGIRVDAADIPYGKSGLDYSTCQAFADVFRTISKTEGSYYYKSCYRVGCNRGTYITTNMVVGSGFRCQNGNYNPYRKISSNGCSIYNGKCSVVGGTYCTKVEFVDCNKNADGSVYVDPNENVTKPTDTTKKTTTTKKQTTTTKKSNKTTSKKTKETTKKTNSTSKTTATSYITTTTTTTTTPPSSNKNIKEIYVNNNALGYKNTLNEYTIQAEASIVDIDIIVELEDSRSYYTVNGNYNMAEDEDGIINIVVTAQDKSTKNVIINVSRYNISSSDCFLRNIYIENYDIGFTKSTYEYSLKLPQKEKSLEITAVAVDDNAYVEINGNEKLKNNSKIKINITGTDDSLCVYTITIKKDNNMWKLIVLFVIIGILLGVGIYFLVKYLRKSKGKYKYE